MLEMLDQMVRVKSGGAMLECFTHIQQTRNTNFAHYIKNRIGDDLLALNKTPKTPLRQKLTIDKIVNKFLAIYLSILRFCIPKNLRDEVFIATSIGERHKWMYDSFSLSALLQEVGFTHIQVLDYKTSHIPNFNSYLLDINQNGLPYKGVSSLYIECKKT